MTKTKDKTVVHKFAATLSYAQVKEARAFEQASLTTFSQAVKAFERNDLHQIEKWRGKLAVIKYVNDQS